MSTLNKWNRSAEDRQKQYYSQARGVGFGRRVESTPDHRDAEEGLTTEGLPAWHLDGSPLSRREMQDPGSYVRHPKRLRRPRSAERHIKASCSAALERFSRHQDAIRPALDEDRSAERGILGRLWRYLRNH